MKKLSLLVLVTLSVPLVAKSPLKTAGKILLSPIVGTSFYEKHDHKSKKKHSHHKPKSAPVQPAPPAAPVLVSPDEMDQGRIGHLLAQKQVTPVVVPEVKPEVIPAVATEIAETFELDATDAFEAHGLLYANPTAGSDDIVTTLSCQAYQAPQELGYKARATEWLKNSWAQLPSMQQMKVSCANTVDELSFHAYKHRIAIAATVTAALAIGGGYYWYKNYYKAKDNK